MNKPLLSQKHSTLVFATNPPLKRSLIRYGTNQSSTAEITSKSSQDLGHSTFPFVTTITETIPVYLELGDTAKALIQGPTTFSTDYVGYKYDVVQDGTYVVSTIIYNIPTGAHVLEVCYQLLLLTSSLYLDFICYC